MFSENYCNQCKAHTQHRHTHRFDQRSRAANNAPPHCGLKHILTATTFEVTTSRQIIIIMCRCLYSICSKLHAACHVSLIMSTMMMTASPSVPCRHRRCAVHKSINNLSRIRVQHNGRMVCNKISTIIFEFEINFMFSQFHNFIPIYLFPLSSSTMRQAHAQKHTGDEWEALSLSLSIDVFKYLMKPIITVRSATYEACSRDWKII